MKQVNLILMLQYKLRDQMGKKTTKRRPLIVTVIDKLNITPDKFRVLLQEIDETSKPKNELDFIWKGPAEVIERRGVVNYNQRLNAFIRRSVHVVDSFRMTFISHLADETLF